MNKTIILNKFKSNFLSYIDSYKFTPYFKFLEKPLKVVDTLLNDVFTNSNTTLFSRENLSKNRSLISENSVIINGRQYVLTKGQWQNIFYTIVDGQHSVDPRKKKISMNHLTSRVRAVVAYLQHGKSASLINKEVNVDLVVDKNSILFISKLIQEMSKHHLYNDIDIEVPDDILLDLTIEQIKTNIITSQYIIRVFKQCHIKYYKRYNRTFEGVIRLPYTGMSNILGTFFVEQLKLLIPKGTMKQLVLEWLQDPNITVPSKLLQPKITLGPLSKFNFSRKEIKFIITNFCIDFYNEINLSNSSPEILTHFELVREKIEPIMLYLARYTVKLGASLVHLMIQENIFTETRLVPYHEVKPDNVKSNSLYKNVRVVKLDRLLNDAFEDIERIVYPHLIEANLKPPFSDADFTTTVRVQENYLNFMSEFNNKIHTNENTHIVVKDPTVLNHTDSFSIDQSEVIAFLEVIRRGLDVLEVESMLNDRVNYMHPASQMLFSIYKLDAEFFEKWKMDPIIGPFLWAGVLPLMVNFKTSMTWVTVFTDNLKALDIPKSMKQYLLRVLNKIIGTNYSIKDLISNALIYSHFQKFYLSSYLDTRGRRYYKNNSLNIQGSKLTKTIVKPSATPLIPNATQKELNIIFKSIEEVADSVGDKHFDIIRSRWKRKYGFHKKKFKRLQNIKIRTERAYHAQLCTYLKGNSESVQHDIIYKLILLRRKSFLNPDNTDEYFSCLLQNIKKKSKALIASGLVTHLLLKYAYDTRRWIDKSYLECRSIVPPYELDANASGTQMTALLLKCSNLAKWSRLLPSKDDLYQTAGTMFTQDMINIMNFKISETLDYTDLQRLEDFIPKEFHWFIRGFKGFNKKTNVKEKKKKYTVAEYIDLFLKRYDKLVELFVKHPDLAAGCHNRDLWKKSIMTYGYNSTPRGRRIANKKYLLEELNLQMETDDAAIVASVIEDYFSYKVQPTLIPTTSKIREISKVLALNIRNNEHAEKITINNSFLKHIIQPVHMTKQRVSTNSYKGKLRGHQVTIKMKKYNEKGYPLLNHKKAQLIFGPNLMHTMDAFIVHTLTKLYGKINKKLQKNEIWYRIQCITTHDCFAFVDPYFAKALIELAYLILYKKDYINTLKKNPNFDKILKIKDSNYTLTKKKKKDHPLAEKINPPVSPKLDLIEIDGFFVK